MTRYRVVSIPRKLGGEVYAAEARFLWVWYHVERDCSHVGPPRPKYYGTPQGAKDAIDRHRAFSRKKTAIVWEGE